MSPMELVQLARSSRSVRRFDASRPLGRDQLIDLLQICPLAASPGNIQPLKYRLVHQETEKDQLFPHLRWARYLKDWQGPTWAERPGGYVMVMGDPQLSNQFDLDIGLVSSLISLYAKAQGLGACVIMAMHKKAIADALALPLNLELVAVIALGYPAEEVILEEVKENQYKYWRDAQGRHHVPKRSLKELLIG